MFSDRTYKMASVIFLTAFAVLFSCTSGRRLAEVMEGGVRPGLSIPSDRDFEKAEKEIAERIRVDSSDREADDGPLIMNAIKDSRTGEMVATDVISASRVVARFRNVAERFGKIRLEFDVSVPEALLQSFWKLSLTPVLMMEGDSTVLDPVCITGRGYRDEQMRGYRRYERFLKSIVGDSAYFIRTGQLEVFLMRYFPGTYAMRNDSSYVSDPVAENLFGVSQREALEHYTRHSLVRRNGRKKEESAARFRKYVPDPLDAEGFRLDTVLVSSDGDFVYRYVQEVRSRPGLKKISVALDGSLFEDGEKICAVRRPDDIVFYVSSLSSLADMTPRYVERVLERRVYENTHAFIDFARGRSCLDTLLPGNRSELARIRKCVDAVVSRSEFVLDSLIVTASCSPEGSYSFNETLSRERAATMENYVSGLMPEAYRDRLRSDCVAENWEQLVRIAYNDSTLPENARKRIVTAADMKDLDMAESTVLAAMPEYRYLREKVYPRLRTVKFDFFLHRRGMVKDTVHTSELDTVYMSGVRALKELDYVRAVEILRPYHDYNTALAFLSAGYDNSALHDLQNISPKNARTDYLTAVALSRLGRRKDAMEAFLRSAAQDSSMFYRANLDPELSGFAAPCR